MLKLSFDGRWGLSAALVQVASKGMDSMPAIRGLALDTSATYEIRVQGYLDENWADGLGPVTILVLNQPNAAPITTITGEFQDQAALAGALSCLYCLGLPLLSVVCIEPIL